MSEVFVAGHSVCVEASVALVHSTNRKIKYRAARMTLGRSATLRQTEEGLASRVIPAISGWTTGRMLFWWLISLFLVACRAPRSSAWPSNEATGPTDLHGSLMTCTKFSRGQRSLATHCSNYPLTRLIRAGTCAIGISDKVIVPNCSICNRNTG